MQIVSDKFHEIARGNWIPLKVAFMAAFTKKKADDVNYWVWDISTWDGGDLWDDGGEDNVIQEWDKYKYFDYSERVISAGVERGVEFPYNVNVAMMDITLDNWDGFFTEDNGVGQYFRQLAIPFRLFAGYEGSDMPNQFVGMNAEHNQVDDDSKTVSIHAVDFLYRILQKPVSNMTMLRDVYTGQVLSEIFRASGMRPDQYDIPNGSNFMPFVQVGDGETNGELVNRLMQAENGKLWLDERGIIRFQPRNFAFSDPVYELDDYQISKIIETPDYEKINHIKAKIPLRRVQPMQVVYSQDEIEDKPSGDTGKMTNGVPYTVKLSLDDPTFNIQNLAYSTSAQQTSYFNAKNSNGAIISGGITITSFETQIDGYKITIMNTSGQTAWLNACVLYGEPAKVYDTLEYEAFTDDWEEDYDNLLELGEDALITSELDLRNYASSILNNFGSNARNLELRIKGNFALQIGDIVHIDLAEYNANYQINSIKWNIVPGNLETTIKVSEVPDVNYWIWDVSEWDGGDVWA